MLLLTRNSMGELTLEERVAELELEVQGLRSLLSPVQEQTEAVEEEAPVEESTDEVPSEEPETVEPSEGTDEAPSAESEASVESPSEEVVPTATAEAAA